jgi:hypothetical protein
MPQRCVLLMRRRQAGRDSPRGSAGMMLEGAHQLRLTHGCRMTVASTMNCDSHGAGLIEITYVPNAPYTTGLSFNAARTETSTLREREQLHCATELRPDSR